MEERTLVLIKPDAVAKCLAGHVITDLYSLKLKMAGLKIVNVKKELAEKHYEELRGKPFFGKLVKHIAGEFHDNANVIAIVYMGENPEEADFSSIRGKYGRVNSKTDCFENVIHASDSVENAEKEIKIWFGKGELIE